MFGSASEAGIVVSETERAALRVATHGEPLTGMNDDAAEFDDAQECAR